MKQIFTAASALALPAGTEFAGEGNGEPFQSTPAGG